jgi:hypothetical protein
MSSKKPIIEGPRQTGFRGDTPATDAISYKQPAAIVPFPDQNPRYGAPRTPNRADMADPNLPPSTGQMNPQPAPPQPARAVPKPAQKK